MMMMMVKLVDKSPGSSPHPPPRPCLRTCKKPTNKYGWYQAKRTNGPAGLSVKQYNRFCGREKNQPVPMKEEKMAFSDKRMNKFASS